MKHLRIFKIAILVTFLLGVLSVPQTLQGASKGEGGTNCNAGGTTNVSTLQPEHYAWNDVIGWIDFLYVENPNVVVRGAPDNDIIGCASSPLAGVIALNCASTPNGNICESASDFKISHKQDGELAGWAWSDVIGWISFCGNSSGGSELDADFWKCPENITYGVYIDSAGDFHGWAWNEVVGWISFNCANTSTCDTGANPVEYKVKTTWTSTTPPPSDSYLLSSVYDTCNDDSEDYCGSGGSLNTVLWQGDSNAGRIRFQVASSRCPNGAPDHLPNPLILNDPVCNNDDPAITTQTQIDNLNMWCQGTGCVCQDVTHPAAVNGLNYPVNTMSCFFGPDGTTSTYYDENNDDTPTQIKGSHHQFKRYYRYKISLDRLAVPVSRVNDVIINWAR